MRRGEGKREGSVCSPPFMVPMRTVTAMKATHGRHETLAFLAGTRPTNWALAEDSAGQEAAFLFVFGAEKRKQQAAGLV
jgi:hypothetical protein